jgi:hypothetical protein
MKEKHYLLLPQYVDGKISPYPTVVYVTMNNHMASSIGKCT